MHVLFIFIKRYLFSRQAACCQTSKISSILMYTCTPLLELKHRIRKHLRLINFLISLTTKLFFQHLPIMHIIYIFVDSNKNIPSKDKRNAYIKQFFHLFSNECLPQIVLHWCLLICIGRCYFFLLSLQASKNFLLIYFISCFTLSLIAIHF